MFFRRLKHIHCLIWYLYLHWHPFRGPMEWQQMQTSAQHEVWSLIETLEARTCYISCLDLLSSDASARRRLPSTLAHENMHESSFGTHTAMHHWRWWPTSSQKLNRQVSILTHRGKNLRAPQMMLALPKRPQCIFVPYDVSANAVVFNFLAASFKLWQIMLHPSCIAFYHCSACVHIWFAARCLPNFILIMAPPVCRHFVCASFDPTCAEVLAWRLSTTMNLSSIASMLALRPGPYPRISSSLCVRGRFVRSSFDTMPISFPTEFQRFDPTWEKALASPSFYLTMHEFLCQAERPMVVCHPVGRWKRLDRLVLRHCACVPVPSRATYGCLSPR